MLTIDNKIYRNLQEQVEANKLAIQVILDEKGVLNQFGIRVIGKVDNVQQLPEQDNPVHLEYGDAYAVGTETPYNLYIWTREMSTTVGDFWFDIGKFPQPSTVPGPQGPAGPAGKDGENSKWYISLSVPSFTAVNNDMCLNVNNGDVYIYEDEWVKKGNIKGPQGIQGPKGDPSTVPGPQGPQGPKGDMGANTTWYLLGELTSTSQLPDPTTVRRDAAYLVNVGETNHLYAIAGTDTLTWVDIGVATGVSIGKPGTGTNAEVFNGLIAEKASGDYSHAEGYGAASGFGAHGEGNGSAIGEFSHAEGEDTHAYGEDSHAEGESTFAGGMQSHAEGLATIATGNCQHVQGKHNIEDTANKYAHIVGNGESSTRSNAHTLDWSGNAWYAGKVSGGTVESPAPVENDNDYVTKKYFDTRISRPNLLINPDFSINQRGITTVSGSNKYSVDRWKTGANNSFVNVLDKGIEVGISGVTTEGPRNAIQQTIEDFEKYKGLPLTLSMKYTDFVEEVPNTTRLIMLGGAAGNKYTILSSVGSSGIVTVKNWTFPTGAATLIVAVNGVQAAKNYSLKIEWIKLEVGTEPTEFIPPLISEELPKCQRYYIKMNANKKDTPNFIGMLNQNKDNLSAQIAVPQELRTMPTITGSGTLRMWNGSTASNISYSIAGNGLQNKMGNNMGVTFIVTDDGTLTGGQIYLCNFQTGGSNIAFDAEIY